MHRFIIIFMVFKNQYFVPCFFEIMGKFVFFQISPNFRIFRDFFAKIGLARKYFFRKFLYTKILGKVINFQTYLANIPTCGVSRRGEWDTYGHLGVDRVKGVCMFKTCVHKKNYITKLICSLFFFILIKTRDI